MFDDIRLKVLQRFELMKQNRLFRVEPDRDLVWSVYLNAIPAEHRQSNTCNCCKSFLRQYSGIVGIDANNNIITLWDFVTDDPEYANAIKELGDYIRSLQIVGPFFNPVTRCGTMQNPDRERNVIWTHYYVDLPPSAVMGEAGIGPAVGTATANKDVLLRSLNEITDDAVDSVIELIGQGVLYRGSEFLGMLTEFKKLKHSYKRLKATDRTALKDIKSNWCWLQSASASDAVSRIRNTALGTLLVDLSEGRDLDGAVTAFERIMAPSTYKRPTALVTPRMVDAAKKRLEELGLLGSLNRRLLTPRDLNVNNALFVHRPVAVRANDVFEQIKLGTVVNAKTLSKVSDISINDFITKVVPTAKAIKALVDNTHLPNFVSLVGPQNPDDPTMFKWGNNFSWSYSGEVTDSIKERVKSAGGKVDGVLRVSLSWHNYDDLDLHVFEPRSGEIWYGNKTGRTGGVLDVDMNAGCGRSRTPVENVCWANQPHKGGL